MPLGCPQDVTGRQGVEELLLHRSPQLTGVAGDRAGAALAAGSPKGLKRETLAGMDIRIGPAIVRKHRGSGRNKSPCAPARSRAGAVRPSAVRGRGHAEGKATVPWGRDGHAYHCSGAEAELRRRRCRWWGPACRPSGGATSGVACGSTPARRAGGRSLWELSGGSLVGVRALVAHASA